MMAVLLGAVAATAGLGAGSAVAEPERLALDYHCPFPVIATQPIEATITSDFPDRVPAGRPTGEVPIQVELLLNRDTTSGLRILGGRTIEGLVSASFSVDDADSPIVAQLTIDPTPVAANSQETRLIARVIFPSMTFPDEFARRILVHGMEIDFTLRNSNGQVVQIPDSPNPFTTVCTQQPGQNNVLATINGPYVTPPRAPTNLRATAVTADSVALAWDPSVSPVVPVDSYKIVMNGEQLAGTWRQLSATISGLRPDTTYTFAVRATYPSPLSQPVTVRTLPDVIDLAYDVTGSAMVKAARTSVTVGGIAAAKLNVINGGFTADVDLRPAAVSTRLFGAFPATAEVGFVPNGQVTGRWADGGLTASATVGLTLSKLTVFGFPVAAAPCRTSVPTAIDLRSTAGFTPTTGGTLTGSFTLPSFTGCQPYAGLVTAAASGPGNTVELSLRVK
jgi:hypothetical protein